jgi:ferrous iron transport protein A
MSPRQVNLAMSVSIDPYVDAAGVSLAEYGVTAPAPPPVPASGVMPLWALPPRRAAVVVGLSRDAAAGPDAESLCRRLEALGFVPGEPVRVVAQGPFGREPLLVEIGSTRFALRHREASCVQVAIAGKAVIAGSSA